jgi:thioredoxin-like negative regulator of GroEL
LKTAVEVDPQNSDASYDLGKALLLQGDAEAAVPALLLRNQTKIAHWLRAKRSAPLLAVMVLAPACK